MFGSLLLALSLGSTAQASEEVAPAESAPVSLVGDGDALGKKRSEKKKGSSESEERSEKRSEKRTSAERSSKSGPGRKLDTEQDGGRSITRESDEPRDRAARTHEAAERRETGRHERAEPSSASASRHHRAAERHRTAAHARAGHHAPAYRAAARHRAASHASHAAAAHHSAWAARHGRHAWYTPWRPGYRHHWYHGVFVYGPPVVVVAGGGGGGGGGSQAKAPKRAVDREGDFSLGVHGGSYLSGFGPGESYGDAGLGLSLRYRPIESLGFEASWTYYDATWSESSARIQQPLQISAQLFAFPWTRVSPYVLGGVTMTDRNLDQPLSGDRDLTTEDTLWGPHAGIGIEFAIGESVSLDFDARFVGYLNKSASDPSAAGAVQGNMGVNFYF